MASTHLLLMSFLAIYICSGSAAKPHSQCVREYTKLGCYGARSRPLSQLLITDRDATSDRNDGHRFSWMEFEASLHSLACRCAKLVKARKFAVFGLQNFGECWSGPDAEREYARDGKSADCYQELSNPAQLCNKGDPRDCAGARGAYYVYRLKTPECTRVHPIDLGIMVHSSGGGVLNGNFVATQRFLLAMVDRFRVGPGQSRLGLIVYGDTPQLCFTFREAAPLDAVGLKFKFLSLNAPQGVARTDRALARAGEALFTAHGGDRRGFPNVLLIITDGRTAQGSEPYELSLKPLENRDVKILAVGVGGGVDYKELLEMAMGKQQNVVHVHNAEELDSQLGAITDKMC